MVLTGTAALTVAQTADLPKQKANQVIDIQIGAISCLDEGTDKVPDILRKKTSVNTLFLATFTYGNGTTSHQLEGHPFF